MTDRTYNGWTNYATWRVNLEMFDGMSALDYDTRCARDLAYTLRECAESVIEDTSRPGPARDYALAFLSDVNWHEIAQHMVDALVEADA